MIDEERTANRSDEKAVWSETYILEAMRPEDIAEVSRVERRCFTNPWPESAYRRELRNSASNYYIVLRQCSQGERFEEPEPESWGRLSLLPWLLKPEGTPKDPIVGFAGMWAIYDEAHITTIGVTPERRGRGLGELLLVSLFDEALRRNSQWVTLEVRVSNETALSLYHKYGFSYQGIRRRYYSDNGEDAHIMWSPSLQDDRYLERFETHREAMFERLAAANIRVMQRR